MRLNRKILTNLITKVLHEEFLRETKIYLSKDNIPVQIRDWAKSILNSNVDKYILYQGEIVHIGIPWHEADREYYQFFELLPNNSAKIVGNRISRTGLEGDGVITGKEVSGKLDVPSGKVLVKVGTYPKRVEIYTAKDAQLFLANDDILDTLSDEQLAVLYWAKTLVPSARPKVNQKVYDSLIDMGLLNKNKSITVAGKNIAANPITKQRLQNSNFTKIY